MQGGCCTHPYNDADSAERMCTVDSRMPWPLEQLGPAAAPMRHRVCAAPRARLAAVQQRAPGSCRSSPGAPPAGRARTRRRPGCWCRSPSPTTPAAAGPWTCAARSGLRQVAAPAPGGPPVCQPSKGAARRLRPRRLPGPSRQVHHRHLPARTHMASARCESYSGVVKSQQLTVRQCPWL